MQLRNSFTVPADPATAWTILLDVPRIAPCMPGAELTETVGERAYKGNAKVRVGPVALTFAGEAEITAIDEAVRTATVVAKGADTKGRGAAEATVVFALAEADGQTRVDIVTDVTLSGSVAQYGRASGLIDAIAGQIVGDFAKNLERHLAESGSATAAPTVEGAPTAEGAPKVEGVAPPVPGPDPAFKPEPPPLSRDNSISGFSLFFRALWSMVRKAFGGAR